MTKVNQHNSTKTTSTVITKTVSQTSEKGEHNSLSVKVAKAPKVILSTRAQLAQTLLKKSSVQTAIWAHTQAHPIVSSILEKRKGQADFAKGVMAQFSQQMVKQIHEGWFRQVTPSNPKADLALVESSMDTMLHAIVSADLEQN